MHEVRAVLAWLLVNEKRKGRTPTYGKGRTPTGGREEKEEERRKGKGT